MNKLVVVESPSKAKTIQKYLGDGYKVLSSKGHISDLPKSSLAVDVDHDYQPTYEVSKPSVLAELRKALKASDSLVLAVDPDREGEAIGWHIARELGLISEAGNARKQSKPVERIVFTEITKTAVQEAVAKPRRIDMDLVNAQQARRVLDRLVGYKLSPLLWKKIRFGLSAGRVQSVAVRLIVDREKERRAFKADEYWSVHANLDHKSGTKAREYSFVLRDSTQEEDEEQVKRPVTSGIAFELTRWNGQKPALSSQSDARKVLESGLEHVWEVKEVEEKDATRQPFPPFTTSLLQQAGVNVLGFTSKRTMQVAQKLYEAGHITYMRTDSYHFSAQAVAAIRAFVSKELGEKYIPEKPRFYANKSKVAQEAHEAIRPTNVAKKASGLGLHGDEARLYDLIWRRAVASQMSEAKIKQKVVRVGVSHAEYQANGRRTVFPGYLAIYSEGNKDVELPDVEIGQKLTPTALWGEQHFTQPPARYSEATLVKELEALGIGRPSTYAPIIQTILARGYVVKEGRYFIPTDTGFVVTELLVKHFNDVVDVGFTAGMEDQLDEIAAGKRDWVKMMDDFYKPFAKNLVGKEKSIDRDDFTVLGESDEKCPECGGKMVIKLGRYGRFLSCSRFPECKGILPINEGPDSEANESALEAVARDYLPAPKTEDGREYILKKGRFGQFWAHPDYPKVKDAQPLQLKPEVLIDKYGQPPKTDDKRDYLLRQGRFGFFWAHPDYPKVKDIISVKKTKGAKFKAKPKKGSKKAKSAARKQK